MNTPEREGEWGKREKERWREKWRERESLGELVCVYERERKRERARKRE